MLVPSGEGEAPQNIFYAMNENEFVRSNDIISPAEAYEEILEGNFAIYNDLTDGDQLHINAYELAYTYDSKGYYQPIYRFKGTLNGSQWDALIPAVK